MKQTLAIIGVGAFGEFMLKHLTPYFDVHIYDEKRDLHHLSELYNITVSTLAEAARCDIIVLAVPIRMIEAVCQQLAPYLKAGQLVMDVASVKCLTADIMQRRLPDYVELIGLHPLFGPQSGKFGIHGLNITLVPLRSSRADCIQAFLSDILGLVVTRCSAEEHDRQMAYVQGLTHMIARVFKNMTVPIITQETKTFALLQQMVDLIKNDSDALFHSIQTDNPFSAETKKKFFEAVKRLEDDLA